MTVSVTIKISKHELFGLTQYAHIVAFETAPTLIISQLRQRWSRSPSHAQQRVLTTIAPSSDAKSRCIKDLFGDKRDTRQQTGSRLQSIIKEEKSFKNRKFCRATTVQSFSDIVTTSGPGKNSHNIQ